MRTIELAAEPLDERALLSGLIGQAPEAGYSLDEVRLGVRVLDRLAAGPAALVLEEAEWRFVRDRLACARWRVVSAGLLAFVDKVLTAPETAP